MRTFTDASSSVSASSRVAASSLRLGLMTELDAGEAAAITLAVEEGADLILVLASSRGR